MTMKTRSLAIPLALAAGLLFGATARADNDGDDDRHYRGARYEVTLTNLTRGQHFTPLLVASHRKNVRLFEPGKPARPELETLAEEGSTAPLAAALAVTPGIGQVVTGNGLTDPGASVTLIVEARRGQGHLSLAAMMIPSNDAFVALNGVPLPRGKAMTTTALAYDAGTERNDELCASIPGPNFVECGGSGGGGAPTGGEEGFVHVHSGMHGIGDFDAAMRDWRNPVARISVRRIH